MSTSAMYPEIVGEIGNGPDGWGKHAARIEALSTLDLMEHARKVRARLQLDFQWVERGSVE